jgi:hypothetical protein
LAKKILVPKSAPSPKGLKTEAQFFAKVLSEAEKAKPKKRSSRSR